MSKFKFITLKLHCILLYPFQFLNIRRSANLVWKYIDGKKHIKQVPKLVSILRAEIKNRFVKNSDGDDDHDDDEDEEKDKNYTYK